MFFFFSAKVWTRWYHCEHATQVSIHIDANVDDFLEAAKRKLELQLAVHLIGIHDHLDIERDQPISDILENNSVRTPIVLQPQRGM